MSFSQLGLSEKVLSAVTAAGYTTPTPIQQQAIPHVLERRDVLGIAQTGTGKTAAFVLPMLTMLETGRARARMPRTLILEPTRELAAQVQESLDKYGKNHKLNVALIIGGVSFDDQDSKLTTTVATITQQLVKTGREPHDKRDTLRQLIRTADSFKNAIIFCNRKREVAQLHRSLVRHGFNAAALHGDLDQSARTAALE